MASMVATSSAAKVIFGPMITFFTAMYSTWRGGKKEDREYRERMYKEEFLSAFTKFETVHKNYIMSFHEFYQICRKMETPSYELVSKFRGYGMEYSTWREDIRCFVEVCRALLKNYRFKKEADLIRNFADAVEQYFQVTFPDGSQIAPSWFSAFLGQFEDLVRSGESPWDASYSGQGFGSDPKQSFMSYLRAVYETELPARWTRVNKAKADLQTALLLPR